MDIPEWVFNNLDLYGNCSLPSKLFKHYSTEELEKKLDCKIHIAEYLYESSYCKTLTEKYYIGVRDYVKSTN